MLKLAKIWGEKYSAYSSNACWWETKLHASKGIKTKYFCNQLPKFMGSKNSVSATAVKKHCKDIVLIVCLSSLPPSLLSFLLSSFLSLLKTKWEKSVTIWAVKYLTSGHARSQPSLSLVTGREGKLLRVLEDLRGLDRRHWWVKKPLGQDFSLLFLQMPEATH